MSNQPGRSWTPPSDTTMTLTQGSPGSSLPYDSPTSTTAPISFTPPLPSSNSSSSSIGRPMPSRSLTVGTTDPSERERRPSGNTTDYPSSLSKSEDLNHSHRRFAQDSNYRDDFSPPPRPASTSSHASASSSSSAPRPPPTTASSTTSSSLVTATCSACGKPMQGPFVRALGTVFHLNCFKCLDCGDVVASKFFPIDGPDGRQSPLCERDYFRRLNLICAKCGTALRGSYITACSKKYHVEHFTCSLCNTLFGAQDSYYEHDGDVYCHFHYSTRFATKCAGCNSAILKQFVEINRNMRDECWHPECYMINKFWNVKVVSRRPQSTITEEGEPEEPSYVEEEARETATTLKEKQSRMEQQVYRIWTVLSAFEESSAACISDMLRQVSNGQYLDAIRMADKFILHVEVLFATIDDLEWHFARLNLKGMSHVREARMLCRKTVELFTLLSHTQETGARRMGMTQELLSLVTGLAHYLKILIRIALTGALKLEREYNVPEAMTQFLDKLHLLAVQGGNPTAKRLIGGDQSRSLVGANQVTQGVTYGFRSLAPENAGESPFSVNRDPSTKISSNPPSDLCVHCRKTVEEDCVRLGTYQRWHSHCIKCQTCGVTASPPAPVKEKDPPKNSDEAKEQAPKLSTARKPPANVDLFLYDVDSLRETSSFGEVPTVVFCTPHAHSRCRAGFQAVPRLEQYAFLLNVALRRLYLLLKKQGVVPVSPTGPAHALPDSDPYRNSSDMRMKSRLDRKLSATAHIPKRSTIVESPAGRTAQPDDTLHRAQDPLLQRPALTAPPNVMPAQHGSVRQGQSRSPPHLYQQPSQAVASQSTLNANSSQQMLRPDFTRHNTSVMIREDNVPASPVTELPPGPQDDTITLADLATMMDAPKRTATPWIAELNPLELALVKHAALAMLSRGPLREILEMDELLEMIEIKKSGFWNKLFKGDKKNVKKKGKCVFGVPLELLVEREGSDSVLGASNATLRIPSFIDDVVSAMRQMDMSIEGIFRKNGNIRRLKDLTDAIDRDASSVDLTTDNPVQLAALLKKFLRDLPDPLLTFKLHRLLTTAQSLSEPERRRQLQFVTLLLPRAHRDTMEVLYVFLKWVASFAHMDEETGSKMDLGNLATVICPSILYSRGRDAVRDDQFGGISVVTEMLENQEDFLTVPAELMPILKDQDFFVNLTDLPSKDFLKKCDNYMKSRQSNGQRPPMNQYSNGGTARLQSPGPERPPIPVSSPSERAVRPHPGMPQGNMTYPPPGSPSLSSSIPQGLQQGPPLRPPPPEEGLQWSSSPRPQNAGGGAPSSRPSSYVQPRPPPPPPSDDTPYSPNGNGY